MAYPEDYDDLEGLDLGECSVFSHTLVDGLIEATDPIILNEKYFVYARYGVGTPKIDVVDTIMDEYLVSDITGTYMDKIGAWKFEVDVPANETSVGDTLWREMKVMVHLKSEDSPLTYNAHVDVIRSSCSMADLCESVANIQATEKKQTEEIIDLANGWRAIY